MILNEVFFDNRSVKLVGGECDTEENVYTLLVGHNGSGKSRLFCKICQIYFALKMENIGIHSSVERLFDNYGRYPSEKFDPVGKLVYTFENDVFSANYSYRVFLPEGIDISAIPPEQLIQLQQGYGHYFHKKLSLNLLENGHDIEKTESHGKLIAVSSSPFDKFPLPDKRRLYGEEVALLEQYVYRGARTGDVRGNSYLRSKFIQLGASFINIFLKPERKSFQLEPLFKFLGIELTFTVHLRLPDMVRLEDIDSEKGRGASEAVNSARFFKGIGGDRADLSEDEALSILESAQAITKKIEGEGSRSALYSREQIYALSLDLRQPDIRPELLQEFSVLVEYDLLDLADIQFKKSNGESYLLSEASSGELCMLFNVLAIAGAISDGAIVLIDEPELSLHPEWQKRFLPLIKEIFSSYSGCHFLLATHSPLVVSSMSHDNMFVVDMEEKNPVAVKGDNYSHHSVDYQLAKVFKTPGYQNEYLISQAVDLLAILSESAEPDYDFYERAKALFELKEYIDADDPAKKLIGTLQKAIGVLQGE